MDRRTFIGALAGGLFVLPLLTSGCASSIDLDQLRVSTPPPATVRVLTIDVDSLVPDTEGDQATLLAALTNAFAARGYQVDSGSLALKATITRLKRGPGGIIITILTIGIGSPDAIDVAVALGDAVGAQYMTFVIRGEVLDKRYADMLDVIRGMAKRIADEVTAASR